MRSRLWHRTSTGAPDAGWTLLEILVVLSIVLIIMSVAFASRTAPGQMAREATLKANLQLMRDAIDQYYADTATYPTSLQDLVETGYIRFIPEDPFTQSRSTWETAPPPTGLFQGGRPREGVFQVRSGADVTALDGSRVSEW